MPPTSAWWARFARKNAGFRFSREKDGRNGGDVGRMGSALERVVQNGDIAGLQFERLACVIDRQRHRAQVHRHVVAHGNGVSARVIDGTGVVAALLDVRRERRLAEDGAHFLGNRSEQMTEQLQFDGVVLHPGFFFKDGTVRGATGSFGACSSTAGGGGSSGFSSGLHSPAEIRKLATACHRSPCRRSTL